VTQALRGSSALRESELDLSRARRRVSEARSANGFGATLQAQVGFNQTANAFGEAYQSPLGKQRLQVGVAMPLLQWGGGRADVQAARAEESRSATTARARREALEEDARFAALQLVQAGRMLTISAKADTVAAKRFEVAKNRYVIGKIGIGELYIAQQEKDAALQQYVQALRGYWAAHYTCAPSGANTSSASSTLPNGADTCTPCTASRTRPNISRAIAIPSATACSLERSLARRIRAMISAGTLTPGTSFARNSALRTDTSGQIPATTGMRTWATRSRNRSS